MTAASLKQNMENTEYQRIYNTYIYTYKVYYLYKVIYLYKAYNLYNLYKVTLYISLKGARLYD